ncbi:MAG: alpha/beta hydrolase [Aromatoleum sp.]|uniref:alpha/beta fold hydrolase n=1 Tax=Aromatoleum sp. TaxID=2307007 RepID=UPI0028958680|nr:alpha/beta hydrolase [Aromatoleum sp.]MDT3670202.1 alpha/beta hydrolase [Aromatoleum sp.]
MKYSGPTSYMYGSQRLRLHYVDWGNPEAPPLILIHGWRDHCRNWDWVAEQLRDEWHVIAPDLRGHGDSAWANDGQYSTTGYVYDLAQLIHQLQLAPANIIAHSLGGHVATRYAGLYPENVQRLMVIEGLGQLPNSPDEGKPEKVVDRLKKWLGQQRELAGRVVKRYATVEEAFERMHAENKHLAPAQARHLTIHGLNRNEDGTYSWKFDNYVRVFQPNDIPYAELTHLWSRITCPVKLVYGKDSWAGDPTLDGRMSFFPNATIDRFDHAGHWVHHDRTEDFVALAREFLATPV